MPNTALIDLNGKNILIVEDEPLLALDMARELEELGATIIGPAPTAFYALQLMGLTNRRRIDAAVLDINLHRATVFEVADKLREREVPFVFATGYGPEALPERFAGELILRKPISPDDLCMAVTKIVRTPRPRPVLRQLPPPSKSDDPPVVVFARALAKSLVVQQQPPLAPQQSARAQLRSGETEDLA